jgi:DNA modification methylase
MTIDNSSENLDKGKSIIHLIDEQRRLEGENKQDITPLLVPIVAESHTPVYNMHRYFARRPSNVFEAIVKHFTNPGDIILDPFMGGGVTVVESLRARRKVVGVDLNPLAWFIVDNEVKNIKLQSVKKQFNKIEKIIKGDINQLYEVSCDNCKKTATTKWARWSTVLKCPLPACNQIIVISDAKKVSAGRYLCPSCNSTFRASECERLDERLIEISYHCNHCGTTANRKPTADDDERYKNIVNKFTLMVDNGELTYPEDNIPDGDRVRDDALYVKGYTNFYQLFTRRNLFANSLLKKAIIDSGADSDITSALLFVFSSSLSWSNKMRKDTGHGIEHHGYWLPDIYYESNVWDMFEKQFDTGMHCYWKGKTYSNRELGNFAVPTKEFSALVNGKASYMLLCQSSHQLPIPNNSVDIVITDPPFGGNVQYAELSNFWAVWLKETLGTDGVIDNALEAIQTRHMGFASEKSLDHYEDMLYKIFKESYRVLKPEKWMVLTFHNRDLKVWMALHRAAHRAGFRLPLASEDPNRGMLYQPPIEHYTTTLHQRATGSMLGDFILSFKRDTAMLYDGTSSSLSTEEENSILKKIEELIKYHGGTDENLLMIGLLPYLETDMHILHKIGDKDLWSLLQKNFVWVEKEKKWFTKDMVDAEAHTVKAIDFIPAEHFTEQIIYSFLSEKQPASLDEILAIVYKNLVNSHKPGIDTIHKVLQKICDQVPLSAHSNRQGFRLKSTKPLETTVKKPETHTQLGLFVSSKNVTDLSHNEIIELLYSYATEKGYDVHIGETEQGKEPKFRAISRAMNSHMEFGLPPKVFDTLVEIDMLLLKGSAIITAVEVTTSVDTADKAVNNRYRNMFIAMPSLKINAFVIVKDKDFKKAYQTVNSMANVKDGINQKITIVRLSELVPENLIKLF